jgi:hypothetical protein
MTDVQKAIEQLGRDSTRHTEADDRDERGSFSFASYKDSDTTDDDHIEGENWHKSARAKLAEVLAHGNMKIQEDEETKLNRERLKEIERRLKPPIDVELSDESEGEDDDLPPGPLAPRYSVENDQQRPDGRPQVQQRPSGEDPPILEEQKANTDTGLGVTAPQSTASPQEPPQPRQYLDVMRTATQASFIDLNASPVSAGFDPTVSGMPSTVQTPSISSTSHNRTQSTTTIDASSLPTPVSQNELPPSSNPSADQPTTNGKQFFPSPEASQRDSTSSTPMNGAAKSHAQVNGNKGTTHPSEWSVEDVVNWLKSKGFDQNVCDKFIGSFSIQPILLQKLTIALTEQEITGDVLLDLDVNLLKSEIGILAFGKRMRIANAIAELRRPPSISYSDSQSPITRALVVSSERTSSQGYPPSQTPTMSVSGSTHSMNSPGNRMSSMAATIFGVGAESVATTPVGLEDAMAPQVPNLPNLFAASPEEAMAHSFEAPLMLHPGVKGPVTHIILQTI